MTPSILLHCTPDQLLLSHKFFYILGCLLLSCALLAQQPVGIHLDEADGLPDVEFYDVLEDSKGFIWLAANKGLYRYDGKTFSYFSNKEQQGRSVFHLVEDDKGRIWCTNIMGQFLYYENGGLHLFTELNDFLKGELAYYYVQDNTLYASSINGIIAVDLETKQQRPVFTLAHQDNQMGALTMGSDGFRVASRVGVGHLSFDLKYTPIFDKELDFASTYRRLLFSYNNKDYILLRTLDGNRLLHVDKQKQQYIEVNLPEDLATRNIPRVKTIGEFLWIISDIGIYKGQIEGDTFELKEILFEGMYTTQINRDEGGNFWVTTIRDGVYVIPNIYLRQYRIDTDVAITAMTKYNDSTLLFGTSTGTILRYSLKRDSVVNTYSLQSGGIVNKILYHKERDLSYISQWSSASVFDHSQESEIKSPAFRVSKDMSIIDNHRILNGTYKHSAWLSISDDDVISEEKTLLYKRVYATHYDAYNGKSYVGNVDHLRRYDENFESKIIRDTLDPILAATIDQTTDSIVWVATYGAGLYGIKDDDIRFHYTAQNGLVSNDITVIKPDGNDLWVVSDKSVQHFDGNLQKWQSLQSRDGLTPYQIVDMEIIGEQLYFATKRGYLKVDKDKIFKERFIPDVYISGVQIADVTQPLQSEYTLPYDKNKFSIDFHSNGFQSGAYTIYDYRLEGYDDQWQTLTNGIGNVVYNSLPAGDYTFEVAAKNTLDNPRGNLVRLPFTVALPFWQQSWFLLLLYLSGLLVSVWLVWRRVRFRESAKNNQLRELAIEKQITDLKLENLRTQMNPHFIFNALNSIQEYIVLNRKEEASDYLGKFADLIRTYLDHSSKGFISVAEECQCLDMYLELEKLRFEEKLAYTIDTSKLSTPERYEIPTMLVQPYVENAIKHGLLHKKEDRELFVSFKRSVDESGKLTCVIRDNGIGRSKAKELRAKRARLHKAFATRATKLRLDLINKNVPQEVGVRIQDLFDEQGQPIGTKVILTIPYTLHT